jgi:hypothetical protein
MEAILGLFGDGVLGGLFGMVGSFGNTWLKNINDEKERRFKLEEAKSKREHSLAMIKAETDATIAEIQANVQRDRIMMEGQADIEESKGRNEAILKISQNRVTPSLIEKMMFNDTWTKVFTMPIALLITMLNGAVDILRTLIRPYVTYGSVIFSAFVTYMAFSMYEKLGVVMTADQLYEIIQTMLRLLTFTTSTVIGFWFMDKSMSRKFQGV